MKARGDDEGIRALSARTFSLTLLFSFGCCAVLFSCAAPFGELLFHSETAGRYIRLLAPVVPVMFLDHMTDAILKGLGEQVAVMWINIADAALSVVLTLLLLPPLGVPGFILLIVLTEVFNFALSFARLRRTTGRVRLPFLFPLFSALLACLVSRRWLSAGVATLPSLVLACLSTAALYLLPALLLNPRGKQAQKKHITLDKKEKKRYNVKS